MPATQLDVKGKLEWAKVFESNRDRAEWNKETDGEYKVTVITDKATAKTLKDEGCMKKIEEVDGGFKVTFSRPHNGMQDWMGGAPIVADIAGKAWDLESNGLIGNGSEGIVKVEIYPTRTGRTGTRLLGLQVLDHVVYKSEGGSSQPRSMFKDYSSESDSSVSSSPQLESDSIPF